MNINGPGAKKLIIRRSPNAVLRIFNVTTSGSVNFSGITIAHGDTPAGASGAGIQNVNSGTVRVTNCTLTGNVSASDQFTRGGGIFNASYGTVSLTNSNLTFNRPNYGGGISNKYGTINITNSTFANNGGLRLGGGIYNETGTVNVGRSTFRNNAAAYDGGGIFNTGTLNVTNSTFYANIAFGIDGFGGFYGRGGGILNNNLLNLTNSTVSANFSGGGGSGVCNINATARVKSSTIALNYGGTTESGAAPDVSGAFTSYGFNLIGKNDGSTGFTVATDKKGTITKPLDPKLDPNGLRSNGGPTQTIALQTGSPAIDTGTSVGLTGTLTTDQRGAGYPRTRDNTSIENAAGGDGTDIGAFELAAP